MLGTLLLVGVVFCVIGGLSGLAKKKGEKGERKNGLTLAKGEKAPLKAKQPLSLNEQPMYFRLVETLPDHVVLAQVSFQAFLDTDPKAQATRNTFDRKYADFVICTKAFDVVAIIELDDSSHQGRRYKDEARDEMLISVGYKVLRYKTVPDKDKLLYDLRIPARAKA